MIKNQLKRIFFFDQKMAVDPSTLFEILDKIGEGYNICIIHIDHMDPLLERCIKKQERSVLLKEFLLKLI